MDILSSSFWLSLILKFIFLRIDPFVVGIACGGIVVEAVVDPIDADGDPESSSLSLFDIWTFRFILYILYILYIYAFIQIYWFI